MLENKAEGDVNQDQQYKEEMHNKMEAQNRRMGWMEEENLRLFNEKNYFKNYAEQAFLLSKDLEKVFQITVQDLKQTLVDKELEIQNMRADIINYKNTLQASPLQVLQQVEQVQQVVQAVPQMVTQAAPQQVPQAAPQQVPQVNQADFQLHVLQATQKTAPQEAPLSQTIWRPSGHPPVTVDECVQNVSCEGNCEHVKCQNITTHKSEELKVTCHDCKERFKDKVSMMNHKRDSKHPSKRKCNIFPDCERTEGCWFVHGTQVIHHETPQEAQENNLFTCNVCEQVFTSRNEMMFHKKRIHHSDILCSNFLNGYCRRGISGEFCWYLHKKQSTTVQNVARPQINLPPPGSPTWNTDFPKHPTMGLSSVVGLQQQMLGLIHQQ